MSFGQLSRRLISYLIFRQQNSENYTEVSFQKVYFRQTNSAADIQLPSELDGNGKGMQSGVAQVSMDHSTTFRQTNSSEDAVLLRAGPREGEIAKTRVS